MGRVYLNLKNYEKAEEAIKKSISINNQFHRSHTGLGIVYTDLKRYDEAEKSFETSLELETENADAWSHLGVLYLIQESDRKALDAFVNCFKLDNTIAFSLINLSRLLHRSRTQHDRAIKYLNSFLKFDKSFHHV